MNNLLTKYFYIVMMLLLAGYGSGQAQTATEQEEAQMRKAMYEAFDTGNDSALHESISRLKDFYLQRFNMPKYYTMWQNEVIYNINHSHYYKALKLTEKMQEDIEKRGQAKELFRMDFLMGLFYSTQDNNELAYQYLLKSLDQIDKEQNKLTVTDTYLMLANTKLFDQPDTARTWAKKALDNSEGTYYTSECLQMMAIAEFLKGDKNAFEATYKQVDKIKKSARPSDFCNTYYIYTQLCHFTFSGEYNKAVDCANQMTNPIDKYMFLSRVYEMSGDLKAENDALKQLIAEKDKRSSDIAQAEVTDISRETDMAKMKEANAKARNTILYLIIIGAATIVCILFYQIWARRKYTKQLNEQNKELKRARDMAEESDRMKTAFIRNVSHHIRTPLNIINGFAEVISDPSQTLSEEERTDIIRRIQENSQIITTSINHLLKLSSVESISVSDSDDRVSCNKMCFKIVDEFKLKRPESVKLNYTTTLEDSVTIRTNREMLEGVIQELLENANRFTTDGRILLTSEINKEGKLQISVTDTGCGIPDEEAENVFNNFEKVDDFSDGLGLGLPLCKRIVTQIGGELVLDRKYRKGSRFVVTLPMV